MTARLLILGLGNPLMGDDGAGPAVIALVNASTLPPGVRAEEGGTDVLNLPNLLRGEREVWIVDAMVRGAAPGTIHVLEHDAVLSLGEEPQHAHHISAAVGIRWMLESLPELRDLRVRLFGIEPEWVGPSPRLRPGVERGVRGLAAELARRAASRF